MAGDHPIHVQDIHSKRIGLKDQVAINFVYRHRVTVGIQHHLAVTVERHRAGYTTVKIMRWKRPHMRFLHLPCFTDGHRLAVYTSLVIRQTLGQEMFVQLLKGGYFGEGHHEVAPAKSYTLFHSPLLVALAWRAEAA